MLLLVLILVLVAFGLLVVALLTGNVLCAWLSVAVSVAAAVVLVVDWLQRRSALKAGGAAATSPASAEAIPLADPDPVTEVLPVVPPVAETAGARTSEAESRFDRPADGQQTVVMPAVQPSGSAARPSGAEGPTTSLGGSPSPSVTEKARESAAVDETQSVPDGRRSDSESTVAVDIRKQPNDGRKSGGASTDGAPTTTTAAAGAGAGTASPNDETMVVPTSDAERSASAPSGAGAASAVTNASTARSSDKAAADATADAAAAEGPTSSAAAGSASRSDAVDDRTVVAPIKAGPAVNTVKGTEPGDTRPSESRGSADPTSAEPESTVSTASAGAATAVSAAAGSAADGASAGAPADSSTRATFGGTASSGHELFDPVDRPADATVASPPPRQGAVEETAVMSSADAAPHDDESEPPEEPLDTAAARIVAALTDEVLVIDEQPRYHVRTCRAVQALSTISLPAREAIELGFTPCGWCTPDAVLSERHRATARP